MRFLVFALLAFSALAGCQDKSPSTLTGPSFNVQNTCELPVVGGNVVNNTNNCDKSNNTVAGGVAP